MTKYKTYISLAFLSFILFSWRLGAVPLMGLDESLYAEVSRQMTVRSNYIVPFFNGEYFFDKPPVVYWMQALCIKIFGVNSFAVRLPSAICAVCLVFFVNWLGNKLFNPRTGFISALISATCILSTALARLAIIDMVFTLFITISLSMFLLCYLKKSNSKFYLLAWAAAGLSVMTKGPAGIVLIGLVILVFLAFKKDLKSLFKPIHLLGLLLFLAISVPWFLLVQRATNGVFFNEFFLHQNLERAAGKDFGHNFPIYSYIPIYFITFAPWSFYVISAWRKQVKLKPENDEQKTALFLAIWISVIFIVFTLIISKLIGYIYPFYPAAALLIGYWFDNAIVQNEAKYRKLFIKLQVITLVILISAIVFGLPMQAKKSGVISYEVGKIVANDPQIENIYAYKLSKETALPFYTGKKVYYINDGKIPTLGKHDSIVVPAGEVVSLANLKLYKKTDELQIWVGK